MIFFSTPTPLLSPKLTTFTYSTYRGKNPQYRVTYIVKWIGSFVHTTVQQLGDAELLMTSSYLVGGTTQDVISLGKTKIK